MHIFADQISRVSLTNHNLRVTLVQKGPDDSTLEVGTLIIPAAQAGNFVNALANSMKQLDEQFKASRRKTEGETQ